MVSLFYCLLFIFNFYASFGKEYLESVFGSGVYTNCKDVYGHCVKVSKDSIYLCI